MSFETVVLADEVSGFAESAGLTIDEAATKLVYATSLVFADLHRVYTQTDIPSGVRSVILTIAGRGAGHTDGVESATDTVGPFSYTSRYGGDGGMYLTKSDRLVLAPFRLKSGLSVVSTTRGDPDTFLSWVPTEPAGSLFPWIAE